MPKPSIDLPALDDIRAAAARIAPYVHRTPVMTSGLLDAIAGCTALFKCENLQKTGAFKARGASNAVAVLSDAEAARGVGTHSSGNHGAAVAMAAARRGVPAFVVMPSTAPAVKKAAVAGYGATIIECEPTLDARVATLDGIVAEKGIATIHPSDDFAVIAGQGTLGIEIVEQVPDAEVVLVPVGGGGLMSGVAAAVKGVRPDVEVIAVEPTGADDAFRSFRAKRRIPAENPRSVADGLLTTLGERTFPMMLRHVDDVITVEDDAIVRAMRLQWTRLKLVVEPSGAVAFAGLLSHRARFAGRRVAVVVCGGNVDLDRLPWVA